MREPEAPVQRQAGYVEVVYALPDRQTIVAVPYDDGLTAAQAFERSRIGVRHPEILGRPIIFGLHGARIEDTQPLSPGDRLEICRPLVADPRRMRFDLVASGKVMGRGRSRAGE